MGKTTTPAAVEQAGVRQNDTLPCPTDHGLPRTFPTIHVSGLIPSSGLYRPTSCGWPYSLELLFPFPVHKKHGECSVEASIWASFSMASCPYKTTVKQLEARGTNPLCYHRKQVGTPHHLHTRILFVVAPDKEICERIATPPTSITTAATSRGIRDQSVIGSVSRAGTAVRLFLNFCALPSQGRPRQPCSRYHDGHCSLCVPTTTTMVSAAALHSY